jgi:hypothetical protein
MSKDHDKKTLPHKKPDAYPLSGEERAKILETALYRMVMIDGMVYGLEDDTESEGSWIARLKSHHAGLVVAPMCLP